MEENRSRRVSILRRKAWTFFEAKKPEEALSLFDEAIALVPEEPEPLADKAEALTRLARHDDALAVWRKAQAIAPRSAGVLVEVGKALVRAGQPTAGMDAFKDAVGLDPRHAGALGAYGNALAENARFQEAIAQFDTLLEVKPKDAEALLCRGLLLSALKRPTDGLESIDKALEINPKLVEAIIHRARILKNLGRLDEAKKAALDVIQKAPRILDGYHLSAEIALSQGKPEEVAGHADKALNLLASDPDSWKLKARAHEKLGRANAAVVCFGIAAMHEGDLPGALERMNEATTKDPAFTLAWIHKAAVYEKLERTKDALDCYDRALAIDAREPRAHIAKGLLLHDKLDKKSEGLMSVGKGVALEPKRWIDLPPHIQKKVTKPLYW